MSGFNSLFLLYVNSERETILAALFLLKYLKKAVCVSHEKQLTLNTFMRFKSKAQVLKQDNFMFSLQMIKWNCIDEKFK